MRKTGIYPFWLWNGQMTRPELSRQIKLAKAGGVAGLAVHGRIGNKVPYLSDQWMELMRFTCEEAKKAGLEIWLYDEQGFPSGDAGGKIPALGEEFQQKILHFSEITVRQARQLPGVIRVFAKSDPRRIVDLNEAADEEKVICFRRMVFPDFPDLLNKNTGREFVKITHEKYYAALKDYFDQGVITGVFTDDNSYLFVPGPTLAYVDDLEESFRKVYNYSILDNLSALVENIPGAEKVRLDYFRHLAELFNERFMKVMHRWCKEHKVDFLGHLSGDEGPIFKMIRRFGDPGVYWKYFEIPGMDDFLLMNPECTQMSSAVNRLPAGGSLNRAGGFPVIVVSKQASSAASQLGDGRCMSEILASAGWGVPLEAVMNHLRFLNILGVNIFVTHDYSYTSGKVAKRDHPASYFFQQPYFKRNEEIFRSVCNSLQWSIRGTGYADTLVIHPVNSVQAAFDGQEIDEPGHYRCNTAAVLPGSKEVTDTLSQLCLQLMRRHISFEFGFESILEDSARVEGNCFHVGKAAYHTVILPDIAAVSGKLAVLLAEFAGNGGKVICVGCQPSMVDGQYLNSPWDVPGEFLKEVNENTVFDLPADLNFTVENGDASTVASAVRKVDDHREYMLHNCSCSDLILQVDLDGYMIADPVSGAIFPLPEKFNLEAFGIVHLIPAGQVAAVGRMLSVFRTDKPDIRPYPGSWKIRQNNCNVYRWESALPFYSRPADFSSPEFEFSPEFMPFHNKFILKYQPESLQLALETALFDSVKVNGVEILDRQSAAHEISPDMYCFEIADLVTPGENVYAFTRREKRPEYICLLGNFSVDESGEIPILHPAGEITFGDLSKQGMPFYWGSVEYTSQIDGSRLAGKLCRLEIPSPVTGAVGVRINGQDLPMRPSAPWRYEISEYIQPGRNEITLIYYGTAQNFLGPRQVSLQKEHFTGWYPEREGVLFDMPQGIPAEPVIALFD